MERASFNVWLDQLAARPILLSLSLFAAGFFLRLLAIGRYVTPDELIWIYRSALFREALLQREWAATLVAGHPGVTTTWLGTAALTAQMLLQPASQSAYDWITRLAYLTPDNMAAYRELYRFLDAGRVAVALVNSLGIVALFWLVKALFNTRVALLAALLLALDPFTAGISGLFHVDGLLATWTILSLLFLAGGLSGGDRLPWPSWVWIGLAGATAALAVLSKSPALLLLPLTGLGLVTIFWSEESRSLGGRLVLLVTLGAVWLGAFLLTLFLLYPALWSAPLEALNTTSGSANRHLEEALRPTFFMGDVRFDHGPAFYPVALLWRLSPIVVGGLIASIFAFSRRHRFRLRNMVPAILLLGWSLLFLAGITLAAKKFDRYLLPVVPALVILSAVAWDSVVRQGARFWRAAALLLVTLHMAMLAASAPYLLSAYNLLLGGPYTAQYLLPLGWGESISAAGRWLNGWPETSEQTALAGIAPSLAPFYAGETLFVERASWQEADHIILTASTKQSEPQLLAQAQEQLQLAHTIRFGLLPQAWIFHNSAAQHAGMAMEQLEQPVSFGGQMRLLAQGIEAEDATVQFNTIWQKQTASPRLTLRLQLVDQSDIVWQEQETDLLNEVYFYPQDWRPEEKVQVSYRLPLPPGMPAGPYRLLLALVDQESGAQLAVEAAPRAPAGIVYEAGQVVLEAPLPVADASVLEIVDRVDAAWQDGDLELIGVGAIAPRVPSGGRLPLELFWQSHGSLPNDLALSIKLGESADQTVRLASMEGAAWQPGTILRQRYLIDVPGDLPAGDHSISVLPLLPGDLAPATIGTVRVEPVQRLFELPDDDVVLALDVRFQPSIYLRGVAPGVLTVQAGEKAALMLFWQTETRTDEPLSAFVHLVDESGGIISQSDQWPGGLPSDTWTPGEVIIDEHELVIPEGTPPGAYELLSGLYYASSGTRLQVATGDVQTVGPDSITLPLLVRVEE